MPLIPVHSSPLTDAAPFCVTDGPGGRECLYLMMFAADGATIGTVEIEGGRASVDVPLPQLARRIAETGAAYLFLVHNHPGGIARPSIADIEATRHIWRMARALGAVLQDHVIFTATDSFSFRAAGLL